MEESAVEVVLFLKEALEKDVQLDVFKIKVEAHTSGISTARSTPHPLPSFPFTLHLLAQLPTKKMSEGFSKATFQFVSSVGSGKA